MRHYHRLIVGGGLLLSLVGCKWDLADQRGCGRGNVLYVNSEPVYG